MNDTRHTYRGILTADLDGKPQKKTYRVTGPNDLAAYDVWNHVGRYLVEQWFCDGAAGPWSVSLERVQQ